MYPECSGVIRAACSCAVILQLLTTATTVTAANSRRRGQLPDGGIRARKDSALVAYTYEHFYENDLCETLSCRRKEICLVEKDRTATCTTRKKLKYGNLEEKRLFKKMKSSVSDHGLVRDGHEDDEDEASIRRCKPCQAQVQGKEVCGSDGVTYSSKCHVKYIACQKQVEIRAHCPGTCPCIKTNDDIVIDGDDFHGDDDDDDDYDDDSDDDRWWDDNDSEQQQQARNDEKDEDNDDDEDENEYFDDENQGKYVNRYLYKSDREKQNKMAERKDKFLRKYHKTKLRQKYEKHQEKQNTKDNKAKHEEKMKNKLNSHKNNNNHQSVGPGRRYSENLINKPSHQECSISDLNSVSDRLLDWFYILKKENNNEIHHNKELQIRSCKPSAEWMFYHLDTDKDYYLSVKELESIEDIDYERCTNTFILQCDTDGDQRLTPYEWCRCFDKAEPPCLRARNRVPTAKINNNLQYVPGSFIPACDSDGYYAKIQCHSSIGYCWCADKHGNEYGGTRLRGKPNCENLSDDSDDADDVISGDDDAEL